MGILKGIFLGGGLWPLKLPLKLLKNAPLKCLFLGILGGFFVITRKWPSIILYSPECYSIFALRSNTSTSNHHFFASSTIQLRLQRFVIRLDDKSRIGTLLRQNSMYIVQHLTLNKVFPSQSFESFYCFCP